MKNSKNTESLNNTGNILNLTDFSFQVYLAHLLQQMLDHKESFYWLENM